MICSWSSNPWGNSTLRLRTRTLSSRVDSLSSRFLSRTFEVYSTSFLVILSFRRRIPTFTNFLSLTTVVGSFSSTPKPSRRSHVSKSKRISLGLEWMLCSLLKFKLKSFSQRFLSTSKQLGLERMKFLCLRVKELRKTNPSPAGGGGILIAVCRKTSRYTEKVKRGTTDIRTRRYRHSTQRLYFTG